jgi:branched-chain amino acid transport system ATP-binding protein
LEEEVLFEGIVRDSGYSGMRVIWDIDIKVHRGETVLILGANGAGKTTYLKSIMGIIKINDGKVLFKGNDITKVPLNLRERLGIIYISEDTFFNNLTVKENLMMGALFRRQDEVKKYTRDVLDTFPELKDKLNSKCSSLSGGQRKMLIMARAIMGESQMLVIDEPSSGLSPLLIDRIFDVISLLKERGIAVLLSEQNVEFSSLSDTIYVIDNGRVVFKGTKQQALEDNSIHRAYFSV